MKKLCVELASSLFTNRVKSNFCDVKSLNVYFPHSIDRKFKVISLRNIHTLEFEIRKVEEHKYDLVMQDNLHEESLATFVSHEDAAYALKEIKVKLYAPSKSIFKFVAGVVGLSLLFVSGALVYGFAHGVANPVPAAKVEPWNPQASLGQNEEQLSKAFAEYHKQQQQFNAQMQQHIQQDQGHQPPQNPSDILLDALK